MSWFDLARIRALSMHHLPGADEERAPELSEELSPLPEGEESREFKQYLLKDIPAQHWYYPKCDDQQEPALLEHLQIIIEEPDALHEQAKAMAQLLAQAANRHQAKSGWLLVVFFDQVKEGLPGIGIFKAETQEWFYNAQKNQQHWGLHLQKGLPFKKLDKAAVFVPDTENPSGWKALVADRHAEIRYWLEGFLGLNPTSNPVQATKKVMELIKGFSEDVLSIENEHEREEQLDFLDRSSNFLKNREAFAIEDFGKEVLQSDQLIQDFDAYREGYAEAKGLSIPDQLNLAPEAVEKEHSKFVRSVIKLDKNFHVYVHGNRDMIERGYDEDSGKHYYKLFFKEEH